MPTFWLQDGAVLVSDGGEPIDCEDCPCEEEVTVACCPNALPTTLVFTTSVPGGVSFSLVWDPANQWWQGSGTQTCDMGPTPQSVSARLWCNGTIWVLRMCWYPGCDINIASGCQANEGAGLVEVSCDPLQINFDMGSSCWRCISGIPRPVIGTITE